MKENAKTILIWGTVILSLLFFYNFLKDYWVMKGENNTKEYYDNKLNDQIIRHQKEMAIKDELLIKAVKDKIDNNDKHQKEISVLVHKQSRKNEKTQLKFQELNNTLFRLRITNKNLRLDIRDLQIVLNTFSAINKELSFALNEREIIMFNNYNGAMSAAEETVKEQYINYLDKIDRVKKMVKK